jgi:hypothetical protein
MAAGRDGERPLPGRHGVDRRGRANCRAAQASGVRVPHAAEFGAWATKIRLDGSSSLRCSMVQGGHLPKAGVYLPHAKSRVVGCRPAVEGADMQHAGHRLVPVE